MLIALMQSYASNRTCADQPEISGGKVTVGSLAKVDKVDKVVYRPFAGESWIRFLKVP